MLSARPSSRSKDGAAAVEVSSSEASIATISTRRGAVNSVECEAQPSSCTGDTGGVVSPRGGVREMCRIGGGEADADRRTRSGELGP